MEFIDTHCHLNFSNYQHDLEAVINRALQNGVNKIVVPGVDLETSAQAVQLADKYPPIFAAVGVHPSDVNSYKTDQTHVLKELLSHEKVVAIGEIGLDYYHRKDNKADQKSLLTTMIDIAMTHGKPMIFHSREALYDLVDILRVIFGNETNWSAKGIFHAFEGDYRAAEEVYELGFLIGAGGPVTYTNASIKHELFSKIGLKCIVLETDGPFLSPQKLRGKRNEPGNLPVIAQKIAELQDCALTEVAQSTTRNANLLFDWIV